MNGFSACEIAESMVAGYDDAFNGPGYYEVYANVYLIDGTSCERYEVKKLPDGE